MRSLAEIYDSDEGTSDYKSAKMKLMVGEIAWLDCPYGRINDPLPGQCTLYTDTNSDELCDHSQSSEGVKGVKGVEGVLIFLILSIYFLHWYLANKTKIGEKFWWLGRAQFRYFWNLVLLLTFIPVVVSGLLLALGVKNFDFSFWHDRLGLVFTIIAALHLFGRLGYFVRKPW